MVVVTNPSINNYRRPLIIADFVNDFMGLAINGDNGYVERNKTQSQTHKIARQRKSSNQRETKQHINNIYPLYPLINYIIDIVMFFGINSWRH